VNTDWYYKVGDRELGPVPAEELRHRAAETQIHPHTLVRKGPSGPWIRADQVHGLISPAGLAGAAAPHPANAGTHHAHPPPLPRSRNHGGGRSWAALALAVVAALLGVLTGLASVGLFFRARQPEETLQSPAGPEPVAERPADQRPDPSAVEPASKPAKVTTGEKPPAAAAKPGPEKEPGTEKPAAPVGKPDQAPAIDPARSDVVRDKTEPGRVGPEKPDQRAPAPKGTNDIGPGKPSQPGEAAPGPAISLPGEMTPAAKPEKKPDRKPGEAAPRAQGDWRIEQLAKIYLEVVPVFNHWRVLEDELAPLRPQLASAVMLCNQLEHRFAQLQARLASLRDTLDAVSSDSKTSDLTINNLRANVADCQREMTVLSGSLAQARASRAGLEVKVRQLQTQQASLVQSVDRNTQQWISLCDPLGKLGRQTHERTLELAAGWISPERKIALPYLARGFSRLRLEQYDRALEDFQSAAEADPRLAGLCSAARAYALSRQGESRKSGTEFAKALKLDPTRSEVHLLRGQVYVEQGKYTQAEKELRTAVRLGENSAEARDALALLLAACPHESVCDGRKAVEYATEACKLSRWRNWVHLDTLAAACAEAADFDAAVKWAKQAIDLAPAESREAIEKRLSLYQAGKPYRMK
jgi:tetratricopeptide (TPR) repeat protein